MRPGFLVRGPDVIPDVDGHDGHAVVLVQDHGEAVRQREHLVGDRDSRGGLLRGDRRRRETSGQRGGEDSMANRHQSNSSGPRPCLGSVVRGIGGTRYAEDPMFSSRLPRRSRRTPSPRPVAALGARGIPLLDLTETNPTSVGLPYPPDLSGGARERGRHALRARSARAWPPHATPSRRTMRAPVPRVARRPGRAHRQHERSLRAALQTAVRSRRRRAGAAAELSAVRVADAARRGRARGRTGSTTTARWSIDRDSVERALTARTRAVLVVSPNNPTGSMLRADDREWLAALCRAARTSRSCPTKCSPTIRFGRPTDASVVRRRNARADVRARRAVEIGRPAAGETRLDRRVSGPADVAAPALERLDVICDTYLSVSTPVQVAAPALIEARRRDSRRDSGAPRHEPRQRSSVSWRRDSAVSLLHARGRLVGGAARARDAVRGGARAAPAERRARPRASRLLLRLRARGLSRRQPSARADVSRRHPSVLDGVTPSEFVHDAPRGSRCCRCFPRRARRSWGIGELPDLVPLARWLASRAASIA